MNKPKTFKQKTPKDQAVVVLMAIEGFIQSFKMHDGKAMYIEERLEELRFLHNYLPEKW
jgi:hypothetical protein